MDSFLERLALEGIEVSLPERLQLLETLRQFGPSLIHEPAKLKYKIAPLLAKNASQQRRIHQLFDEYLEEAVNYEPPSPPAKKPWWQKWERWQLGLLGLGLMLLPLLFIEINLIEKAKSEPIEAHFEIPEDIRLNESITFKNTSIHVDTANTQFSWQLFDGDTTAIQLDTIVNDTLWKLQIDEALVGRSAKKLVRLVAEDTVKKKQSRYQDRFTIYCSNPPEKPAILAPKKSVEDTLISFSITDAAESRSSLRYVWNFGDGKDTLGTSVSHVYESPGIYEVVLRVIDTTAVAFCQVDTSHTITISPRDEIKAYLADLPLLEDEAEGTVSDLRFFWMSWLLLGLLIAYAAYQFWKWLNQPPPKVTEAEMKEEVDERFSSADRGPYNIPFENYESHIRVEENLFRLADKLRKRQEEGRMVLDIPASVRQTVDLGGFPVLLEKQTTLPPEYLFLIDEQSERSHQAQLYDYLVTFLRDKDVFINTFHYNASFHRFWNPDFPDGVTLERLRQLFPRHRLVVLGDGYDLMDQSGDQLKLKSNYQAVLEEWPSRLLLTPIPPSSWTYREATLYQLFPIFDSDASGFAAALKYLDVLAEEADDPGPRPSFTDWEAEQALPPEHPDINHRIWRKLSTYQDYLADYPGLYRWLCALTVYPEANWQLTLAIGQAIDAPVNFDNLLLLSRIPWLQGKSLHPKLRQQLQEELDEETEAKARAAVQEALAEVAPKVVGSHVNTQLQTNLAIQSFLLNPEDLENRALIEQLKQYKLLGKRQLHELDGGIQRKTKGSAQDLEAYLTGAGEAILYKKDTPLYFNNNFYYGLLAATISVIIGLFMLQLNDTDTLRDWVLGEQKVNEVRESRPPQAYGYFLKEETSFDPAVVLNNQAVEIWERSLESNASLKGLQQDTVEEYLSLALQLRSNYQLAQENQAKFRYNQGVATYNDFLDIDAPTGQFELLTQARENFLPSSERDTSIAAERLHAEGLTYWYQRNRPKAAENYQALNSQGFFQDFPLEPNLQTLIDPPPPEPTGEGCNPVVAFSIANEILCQGDEVVLINDSPSEQNFEYFLLDWGDGQVDSFPDFQQARHSFGSSARRNIKLTGYMQCDSTGAINPRTVTQWISHLEPPKAPIAADPGQGCPPFTLSYYMSDGPTGQHEWKVVQLPAANQQQVKESQRPANQARVIATSSDAQFRHTFEEEGQYQIWLYVQNACGRDSVFTEVNALSPAECGRQVKIAGLVVGTSNNSKAGRQPIAGAIVDWETGRATTDAQGAFSIPITKDVEEVITMDVEHPDYLTKAQAFDIKNYSGGALTITLQAKDDDRDGDGVANSLDACPDQPGSTGAEGCPDRDGDGIRDAEDNCPDQAGESADRGCPDPGEELGYQLVFEDSWVKSRDLLGDKYFLPIEDKAYIWPLTIKRSSVIVLVNQSRTSAARGESELFYGELEPGQKVQVRTGDVVYQITLKKIARAGLIRTRGAYFTVEKAELSNPNTRYTIQVGTYRDRGTIVQRIINAAPEEWDIWEEDLNGTKRLNIGIFDTKAEADAIMEQVKLISPSGFVKSFIPEELGEVVDLRDLENAEETLNLNLNLYFDQDEPRRSYDENRDYASYTDEFLDGYSSQANRVGPSPSKGKDPGPTPEAVNYPKDSRIGKYIAANCNGDTNELAVTRFFDEIRDNYRELPALASQLLDYYQEGYKIQIDIVDGSNSTVGSGAARNSLFGRRLSTVTNYFRNYFEREGVKFDVSRITFQFSQPDSQGPQNSYPTRGKCSTYDVRAARDRKLQIVGVKLTK
ncbi:MAG: PKD domain-containing protein [Saprospiraceae bacterium]|nr:PKD domain-containing protein [Saprospiraceae bacterium]